MSCSFDKELIQEFAVGEAGAAERRQAESHLTECAECRLEVAAFRRLARDLAELPGPEFPSDLEGILVRASIQARRSVRPVRETVPRTLRPSWILALGSLAGATVLVAVVLLLWPGQIGSLNPVDKVVGGGVGHGIGLLDGILRWTADLRAIWNVAAGFVGRFAPLGRIFRLVLGGIDPSIWAALVLGAAAATALLWRITSPGQRKVRGVRHAKPQH